MLVDRVPVVEVADHPAADAPEAGDEALEQPAVVRGTALRAAYSPRRGRSICTKRRRASADGRRSASAYRLPRLSITPRVSGATVAPCSSAASKTPSHEAGSVDARAASTNRMAPPASSMFVPDRDRQRLGGRCHPRHGSLERPRHRARVSEIAAHQRFDALGRNRPRGSGGARRRVPATRGRGCWSCAAPPGGGCRARGSTKFSACSRSSSSIAAGSCASEASRRAATMSRRPPGASLMSGSSW